MSQIRTFLSVVLPSLLAGGLLFGSAAGRADDGRAVIGFWPAASDPAATVPGRVMPVPPAPPAPPAPPVPPAPPAPPHGVSVSIHDGKVQIDGVKELVAQQLAAARAQLASVKDMPPDVRGKLDKRLGKLQDKLDKRLAKLSATDLEQLGEQLGEIGSDVSEELSGLGEELGGAGQQWADQWGKQLAKGFSVHAGGGDGSFHWDTGDHDDPDDDPTPPTPPAPPRPPSAHAHAPVAADADGDDDDEHDEDRDDDDAIAALGDAGLSAAQRAELAKLRADTERQVAATQAEVERMSDSLRAQLANPAVTDAEVARSIDAISAKEATIRKARVLAWVAARRALDAGQRAKIEGAAHKHAR